MDQQTLILVTGQHRSGTSATAGCLAKLGVATGSHLMPGNASNPKGYFEDLRAVEIHDWVLREHGTNWANPQALPSELNSHVMFGAKVGLKTLFESFADEQFLIKDPRATLFLPLWQLACAEAGIRLVVLTPQRAERAIVNSLLVREGWPPEQALQVVRGYQRAMERWPKEIPTASIDFPHHLWQLSQWLRVAEELEIDIEASRIGLVHGFLEGELVHHG